MRAASEQQRGRCVAEVVPAYARQPCAPEKGLEVAVDYVLRFEGRADGGREYEPVIHPPSTSPNKMCSMT